MTERRVVLEHCGAIDPTDIGSYLRRDGFSGLKKALAMGPERVIREIKESGLKGRGGAGFSCGVKWDLARSAGRGEKFLVCNADEGEVGTFKDRYIVENDPFSIIEGIAIAVFAIGAKKAYIYLRAEYRFLSGLIKDAIAQASKKGLVPGLEIELREGAGAYVCGEESALMNSIEGKRPEVRFKPPFPTQSGLFGRPTVVNNVETLVNVPRIISRGAAWFRAMGTAESAGTKVFSVTGDVKRSGVYELVLGSRLSKLVIDLAGAVDVKLVQVGGATGRVIPASMIDIPLSYETVLGSGGIVVLNGSRDVIDFVYRTMEFLNEESCGFCTPCREGTEVMIEILGRLAKGDGAQDDIKNLEELSRTMMDSSLCGLGQAAPIPIIDTLGYFRNEYENRIMQSVFFRSLRG